MRKRKNIILCCALAALLAGLLSLTGCGASAHQDDQSSSASQSDASSAAGSSASGSSSAPARSSTCSR